MIKTNSDTEKGRMEHIRVLGGKEKLEEVVAWLRTLSRPYSQQLANEIEGKFK